MKAEQLRKSILQMAIQGKLVPQDSSDEPASVLLEKIRVEKERLIKQGKIKKDKNDSVIFKGEDGKFYEKIGKEIKDITEEIDFDLPSGWELARISSIVDIQTGASFKKESATQDKTQIRVLRGGNISQNSYKFYESDIFINKALINDKILLKHNDLITPAVTSIENIGKIARIEKDYENVTAGGFVFIIRPYLDCQIFSQFVLNSFQSQYFINLMKSITKKSGQAFYNLGKERFLQLLMPIPPLNEQKRIVEAIEKFEPLLAEYEKLEQQATKLDNEIFDKLKKSVLQYAIQGKLVPQDSSDEPASVLLAKIKAEKESLIKQGKIKKEKPLPPITDDEKPFDIPDSWEWVRLGVLATKFTDGTHSTPKYTQTGIPFLSVKDMSNGYLDFTNTKFISKEEHEALYKRCNPEKGDLLITKVGTTGIPVIVNTDKQFSLFVSVALMKFSQQYLFGEYLFYLINSPLVQEQAKENTRGVGNKNWVLDDIKNTIVPLPPLNEQKRIVARIEEIFAQIDKMKV